MLKIERILAFETLSKDSYLRAVFTGLIFCLSPEEACELLDVTFQQEYAKRMAIKKKIRFDMGIAYLNCHDQLIDNLMTGMKNLPNNKRQSSGYCLTYLLDVLPENKVKEVVRFFLNAKWKHIRNRGYKWLLSNWDDMWVEQAKYNLMQYNDLLAARLAIEQFSVEYLIEKWEHVFKIVKEHYLVRRLCVKIGSLAPKKLYDLKKMDSISYVYVLVKLNMSLDESEAIQIFKANLADKRLELLIWCFGRMKLWDVLEYVYIKKEEALAARHEAFLNRFAK